MARNARVSPCARRAAGCRALPPRSPRDGRDSCCARWCRESIRSMHRQNASPISWMPVALKTSAYRKSAAPAMDPGPNPCRVASATPCSDRLPGDFATVRRPAARPRIRRSSRCTRRATGGREVPGRARTRASVGSASRQPGPPGGTTHSYSPRLLPLDQNLHPADSRGHRAAHAAPHPSPRDSPASTDRSSRRAAACGSCAAGHLR